MNNNLVTQNNIIRRREKTEKLNQKRWDFMYGWTIEEYKNLQETSERVNIPIDENIANLYKSGLPSIPITTNRVYGWLNINPKFCLEKYGPDIYKVRPIPDKYKLEAVELIKTSL